MSLELRKTSKLFYSRIVINGKRQAIPLTTSYEGTPPLGLRLKENGDAKFEASRQKALTCFALRQSCGKMDRMGVWNIIVGKT